MKKKKIIRDGVDVSKCPHINAYFPDSPKCQQGMGVGGCGSECRGKCSYVDELKIHNEIQQLKEENNDLKETIQELNQSIQTCNVERTKLYRKLEKIEECINTTCFDYVGMDMIYFKKELLQIIRGESE